ncbi:methylated-DNA--[protein]-cysteine S-methyltransferase [Streptomyces sp. NPDC059651]|uniref:methylated-DNA--[protein]-cysteine S-methyltransferase n=1 Tax=Streptomyces sp. NPDC059651 TaxID=3346897 RepID=UPI0036A283CF
MPDSAAPTAARTGTDVSVTVLPTPLGDLRIAATADALVYCGFQPADELRARLERAGLREAAGSPGTGPRHPGAPDGAAALLDTAAAQLDAYLAGRLRSFDLPLDLRLATPFSRETVSALDAFVPYGRTATYGALAEALNRPRAARAVGTALGSNPLCVVLPCHRIVGSTGALTGYAGGVEAKRHLLGLEARP